MVPANDELLSLVCLKCGATGELVTGADPRPSKGFQMIDGAPYCCCGSPAGMSYVDLSGGLDGDR